MGNMTEEARQQLALRQAQWLEAKNDFLEKNRSQLHLGLAALLTNVTTSILWSDRDMPVNDHTHAMTALVVELGDIVLDGLWFEGIAFDNTTLTTELNLNGLRHDEWYTVTATFNVDTRELKLSDELIAGFQKD